MKNTIHKVTFQKLQKTKNGKIMLLSKCSVCDREKSKFIIEQEVGGLLSSLGIKTSLSKIASMSSFLF